MLNDPEIQRALKEWKALPKTAPLRLKIGFYKVISRGYWLISHLEKVTPKRLTLTAGFTLLGILGTQQVIINTHQIKSNIIEDKCIDAFEDKNWWQDKADEEKAELIGRYCRQ